MQLTDEQFAWWLVGLVDGEGHFGVQTQPSRKTGERPYLRCVFRVAMASGDHDVLVAAHERTGWGKVYSYAGHGKARQDYTVWTADMKSLDLVTDFFDRYPLQSKKRHDYEHWAPAARAQAARRRAGRGHRDEEAYAIMWKAYEELRALDRGGRLRAVAA